MNTDYEFLKAIRKKGLTEGRLPEEVAVKFFMDELSDRQRRKAKKNSSQRYDFWTYYVSYNGRLARVTNSPKNPVGERLKLKHKLNYDKYGILRADDEITVGQFVKHRALIDELDPTQKWDRDLVADLEKYFDGGFNCKMIIDRDFATAYEPDYHDDFCLEGDLVTGESCMSGDDRAAQEFYGGIDGCYVCRFENNDGEQVGRCIMYKNDRGQRHFIRIYAKRDYAHCALRLLRKEMTEDDVFGRDESISLYLRTNWDGSTQTMYLDGENYGVTQEDDALYVVNDDYMSNLKYTGNISLRSAMEEDDYYECNECGRFFNRSDAIQDEDDNYYCCESCAQSAGLFYCDSCGKWTSETIELPDGSSVCSSDCAYDMGYKQCEWCGEWFYFEDGDGIETKDYCVYCSEDCARQAGYTQCVDCERWYKKNKLYEDQNGDLHCFDCVEHSDNMTLCVKIKEETNDETKEDNND